VAHTSLTTRWESHAQKDSFFFLPCSSDSCSAHRIGSCRNQKSATTSSRGGLGEHPPPQNPNVASLTTRWESRAQKYSFFFLPCSSDSYSAHRIDSCRNQKNGDNKFKRRPWRAPPQILMSPASPRGGNRTHKKILFFSK
jgi:hypothetical protein